MFDFDPEFERTLHACRRENQASTNSPPISDIDFDSVFSHTLFDYDFEINFHNMAAKQRTLRELDAPDINYNVLCIEYPVVIVVVPFELKSSLMHLLPRFNGLASEDPHKHLKEFQDLCSTPLRSEGIIKDHIKSGNSHSHFKELQKIGCIILSRILSQAGMT